MFSDGRTAAGDDLRLRRFAVREPRRPPDLRKGDVNARREEVEQLLRAPQMLQIVEVEQAGVAPSMAEIAQDGGAGRVVAVGEGRDARMRVEGEIIQASGARPSRLSPASPRRPRRPPRARYARRANRRPASNRASAWQNPPVRPCRSQAGRLSVRPSATRLADPPAQELSRCRNRPQTKRGRFPGPLSPRRDGLAVPFAFRSDGDAHPLARMPGKPVNIASTRFGTSSGRSSERDRAWKGLEQRLAVGGAADVHVEEARIDGVAVDIVAAAIAAAIAEQAGQERIVPAPVEGRAAMAEIAETAVVRR